MQTQIARRRPYCFDDVRTLDDALRPCEATIHNFFIPQGLKELEISQAPYRTP
jgi:hypothetical protein